MVARSDRRPGARRARAHRPRRRSGAAALTPAQRREQILERLSQTYSGATTALHYGSTFQLLVAVILSAQCTDARVNLVTPSLFSAYRTPRQLAAARPRDVEKIIKSCGFFRMKTRNLIAAATMLAERFGGAVPQTMDELLELPGVGRKTANVILAVAFRQDAIAVDTHVFRVANRLGLAHAKTAAAMERALMKAVPRPQWSDCHHWLIHHGRQICHARNPECARCPVVDLCPSARHFLAQARRQKPTRRVRAARRRSSG